MLNYDEIEQQVKDLDESSKWLEEQMREVKEALKKTEKGSEEYYALIKQRDEIVGRANSEIYTALSLIKKLFDAN